MKKQIFIDTNIYLGFLEVSTEKTGSITELKKIIKLGKLSLICPKITKDEFFRRVPLVKLDYCKRLDQHRLNRPQLSSSLREKRIKGKKIKERIRDAQDKYNDELILMKKAYLDSVKKVIREITSLFKFHDQKSYDEVDLIKRAHQRKLLGNPPGKMSDPIGDELEWEIILNHYFDKDLIVVSADSDWQNPEDDKQINPFLKTEWATKTERNLSFFNSLGEFINDYTEEEKVTEAEIREEKNASKFIKFYVQGPSPSVITGADYSLKPEGNINYPYCGGAVNPLLHLNAPLIQDLDLQRLNTKGVCSKCGNEYQPASLSYGTLCDNCRNNFPAENGEGD